MKFILGALITLLLGALALTILFALDRRAERSEWKRLTALQPSTPALFRPAMVDDLPEPARRYFLYTILPGTPLLPVAEIEMTGKFSLGTKEQPAYQAMEARQILAAPEGFVWTMRTREGLPMSGSDAATWTRFRIFGLIPVARFGGTSDHSRSAFGRYVAEAIFWTPAALLPGPDVTWTSVDTHTARVTVRRGELEQSVDVTVDSGGRPVQVVFQRWSNANPDKVHRLQPFGGVMSDFREVEGFRLPFYVEAGNMFGTDEYFPFFIAEITDVRFPQAAP
ncbi:DUF6544 family protein [Aliidiomarina sp. Khilg15.8]